MFSSIQLTPGGSEGHAAFIIVISTDHYVTNIAYLARSTRQGPVRASSQTFLKTQQHIHSCRMSLPRTSAANGLSTLLSRCQLSPSLHVQFRPLTTSRKE